MQETYTDWTWVSLSPLTVAQLTWLGVAIFSACAWVLWRYFRAKASVWLMLLRLLSSICVFACILEPALQVRAVRKVRSRLAIVVDTSRSMTLATETGHSRHDRVQALLRKSASALAELATEYSLDWFDLMGPTSVAALQGQPTGDESRLVEALEEAHGAGAGRPLAGMVLISDGADTGDLAGKSRGQLSSDASSRLRQLKVPVNTVDVALGTFKDVRVLGVESDDFAFVHNTFAIEVKLFAEGFPNLSVPLTLKREGLILATQEVQFDADGRADVTFKTKPDKIGEFVYTVSVPPVSGEAITSNNEQSFVVQIIRDKIRVLQVAGRPSWDERFLRQHLKENPNADLISFFILRTPTDDPSVPENELSLIPFPVNKLFTTELRSFDVIIFQNFDYRPYRMAQYLPNIRDAVRDGVGFVMLGGDESFGGGGYLGTAIDEILPVRVDVGGMVRETQGFELTEAGRRHPVTDLTHGAGNNEAMWRALPKWTSLNHTTGLAAGASALVTQAGPHAQPWVAVMEVGQGRAMAIATDAMWRWRFTSARDGGTSERAYHRFWSNALRWLVRDPEHARVRVLPEKRRFDTHEPADIVLTVSGNDYQPVPAARLQLTLEQTGGQEHRMDEVVANEAGVARHRYNQLPAGAYRLRAVASLDERSLGEGGGVFVVESRSAETSQGGPRPDLLQGIAKTTDAAFLRADEDVWEHLQLAHPDVVEVDRRRNIEIWDNAWALALIFMLLGAEWILRRSAGYL